MEKIKRIVTCMAAISFSSFCFRLASFSLFTESEFFWRQDTHMSHSYMFGNYLLPLVGQYLLHPPEFHPLLIHGAQDFFFLHHGEERPGGEVCRLGRCVEGHVCPHHELLKGGKLKKKKKAQQQQRDQDQQDGFLFSWQLCSKCKEPAQFWYVLRFRTVGLCLKLRDPIHPLTSVGRYQLPGFLWISTDHYLGAGKCQRNDLKESIIFSFAFITLLTFQGKIMPLQRQYKILVKMPVTDKGLDIFRKLLWW